MRRAGVLGAAIVVALIGTVGLIAFFQSRDDAELEGGGGAQPGVRAPDETSAELQRGNVLLTYREAADEKGLQVIARDLNGAPASELVDEGIAVIIRRVEDQPERIVAHAYERRLAAQSPEDPALREFAEVFLGQGKLEP